VKFFSFNPIAQLLEKHVFLFKSVDAIIYERYKVLQFPQVTVIKEDPSNVLFSFVGCNLEKSSEALSLICEIIKEEKPRMKLNLQKKHCPAKHQMEFIN
jgi:hypothetical protein